MDIKDKLRKILEFPELKTLKQASELIDLQWYLIEYLINERKSIIELHDKQLIEKLASNDSQIKN